MNFYKAQLWQVSSEEMHEVAIYLAGKSDLNMLREWKNNNHKSFFFQDFISESQQRDWFESYLLRGNDYMFIAELDGRLKFGCLGCRYVDNGEWDIYNVINGSIHARGKGYMSAALKELIRFCRCKPSAPIRLKVLKTNPARYWYEKNGFAVVGSGDNFLQMQYCVN